MTDYSAVSVHGFLCPPSSPPRSFWTFLKLLQLDHGPLALGTSGEVQEEGDEGMGGALEPDPPIQRVATPLAHDQLLGPVTDTRGPGLHSCGGIGDLLVLEAFVVVEVVVVNCHQPGHPGLGDKAGLEPGACAHLLLYLEKFRLDQCTVMSPSHGTVSSYSSKEIYEQEYPFV